MAQMNEPSVAQEGRTMCGPARSDLGSSRITRLTKVSATVRPARTWIRRTASISMRPAMCTKH
jgi:hypothetical protein